MSESKENTNIGVCPLELLNLAILMSQDIQEYIDAGKLAGSNMATSEGLLEEFNELYARTNQHWKNIIQDDESATTLNI